MEEADKLGRLLVPETVAPRVLDKRELAVDPLADRRGGRLRKDEPRDGLELGHTRADGYSTLYRFVAE